MRTPKFLDRMRNKGFEDVSGLGTEEQVVSCRVGNIELSRLFSRAWVNHSIGRADRREASRGVGRVAFFKEKDTTGGIVKKSDSPNPAILVVNEDRRRDDTRAEYNDAITQDGEVAVTLLIEDRRTLEASAREICSLCLTNRDNRCGNPSAPYDPMSLG